MENEIPANHDAILRTVSAKKPGNSTVVFLALYKAARSLLDDKAARVNSSVATSRLECNSLVVATATDISTGVYVQLSQETPKSPVLMTTGQKYSLEYHDAVSCQINTKVF